MSCLKNVFVPFFSAALIFSSDPVFPQNLVDMIPGFYYLEEPRDGFISVRACPTSTTKMDFMGALACPIVAEISTSDLENFLAGLSRKAKDKYNGNQSSDGKSESYLRFMFEMKLMPGLAGGMGVLFALIEAGWPERDRTFPSKSAPVLFFGGVALIAISAYLIDNHPWPRSTPRNRQQSIVREIRSGVVGQSRNREAVLQQFTDFINQYGVRPGPEAAEFTLN